MTNQYKPIIRGGLIQCWQRITNKKHMNHTTMYMMYYMAFIMFIMFMLSNNLNNKIL